MVIDTEGRFPDPDAEAFYLFGAKLRERENSKAGESKGKGNLFIVNLKKQQEINQIQIEEDIKKGERIRKYIVEAWVDDTWEKVCEGTSVGHKRIERFDKIKTSSVRLSIVESVETPVIKCFSVYLYE
jgi:alpha-L-fucosidase